MSAIQAGGDTLRIGIDVGGTKIAGVLLAEAADGDARPKLLAERSIPARPGAEQLVDDVVSVVGALTKDAPAAAGIATIGIGTPGMVDAATGAVENIANLDIVRVELGGEVARRTGVPTRVENDVNAAALGAAAMLPPTDGAGDKGTVVFLNLGTGLAAGVIRGGELDHGYSNNVGEIGHVPVEPHRWPCACGQRGCLETAASGGAATRLWPQDDPPMPAIIAKAGNPAAPDHAQAAETLDTIVSAIADAIDIGGHGHRPAQHHYRRRHGENRPPAARLHHDRAASARRDKPLRRFAASARPPVPDRPGPARRRDRRGAGRQGRHLTRAVISTPIAP